MTTVSLIIHILARIKSAPPSSELIYLAKTAVELIKSLTPAERIELDKYLTIQDIIQ